MQLPYVETDCTIHHNGKSYTSGGAYVAPNYAIAYIASDNRHVTDWRGNVLGTCRMTAEWRTPRSYMSDTMRQYRFTIDGITYTGRSCGEGMVIRGKPVKA